jgi:hypothetical protein
MSGPVVGTVFEPGEVSKMKKLLVATLIATLCALAAPVAFADDSQQPHPTQPIKGVEGPDIS